MAKTLRLTRDNTVLKLVHPGGYVEVHTEPVMAAEVMKKNPRHRVTRPDVFKFPWIVVRPESVLKLGRVFFIVPDHTIHALLKARDSRGHQQQNTPAPPQQHGSRRRRKQQARVQSYSHQEESPIADWFHSNPEVQFHDQQIKQPEFPMESAKPKSRNHEGRLKHQSGSQCWPDMTPQYPQNPKPQRLKQQSTEQKPRDQLPKRRSSTLSTKKMTLEELESQNLMNSSNEVTKQQDRQNIQSTAVNRQSRAANRQRTAIIPLAEEARDSTTEQDSEVPKLKSCLSAAKERKSRGLRVRFILPDTDDKKFKKEYSSL